MNDSKKPSATTTEEIIRAYRVLGNTFELSTQQFAVLCIFADGTPRSPCYVAEVLHGFRGHLRNVVHRLHDLGMVQRVDRGVYKITLEGADIIEKYLPDEYRYETDASS